MRTSSILWVLIVIIVIVGAGWYVLGHKSPTSTPPNTNTQAQGSTTSATVLVAGQDAKLGGYLYSPVTGKTLYTYAKDSSGVSNCSGQCAAAWPPYDVEPGITLLGGAGVSGQLGTLVRADGNTQLTYNGMPLYSYSQDKKQGDTNGQNVGGVWTVAKQ